ncbi:hypothetical protein DFJ73DRAFT_819654 [Zopfochytrium polystomum]|nr:hypothetical protein DFJ73DRAFT_819654 [Zopfochytrium polystomum]
MKVLFFAFCFFSLSLAFFSLAPFFHPRASLQSFRFFLLFSRSRLSSPLSFFSAPLLYRFSFNPASAFFLLPLGSQ